MFKNKVLLLTALLFVGVSFGVDEEEQDPTMFQNIKKGHSLAVFLQVILPLEIDGRLIML